jgi:hypothetical protein
MIERHNTGQSMSESSDKELRQLISSLGKKPGVARAQKSVRRGPDKIVLLGGILLLAGGIAFMAYSVYSDSTAPVPEEDVTYTVPQGIQPGQPGGPAAIPTGGGPTYNAASLSMNRQPETLADFEIDLKNSAYFPPRRLTLPASGKPLTVYCVMFASLDPATESVWRQAGMFDNEGTVLSPFLRKVTVRDQQTLENLIDWHVEAVTLTQPKHKAIVIE